MNPSSLRTKMKLSRFKPLYNKIRSPFFRGIVPVYHSIGNNTSELPFSSNIHHISSDQFEKQLYLLKKKYDFVFVDELSDRANRGLSIRNLVSITFDDGYKNFYQNALPIIESHNIPVTMFLTTQLLQGSVLWRDKVRYTIELNWVQDFSMYLKEQFEVSNELTPLNFYQESKNPSLFRSSDLDHWLDSFFESKGIVLSEVFKDTYLSGKDLKAHPLVQFGNHTDNHYMMSTLDGTQQSEEIEKAQSYLNLLNLSLSEAFAIPFGDPASFNQDTLDAAYELGFKSVLLAGADKARGFLTKTSFTMNNDMLVGMRFLPGKHHFY